MTRTFSTLLLTTALTVPAAGMLSAQTADTACGDLEQIVVGGLPADFAEDEDRLREIAEANDGEVCVVEVTRIREASGEASADADANAEEGAVVADTARTTVTLEDEVTIEGMVFLDRVPPQVDIESGETDVQIQPGSPSITVTNGMADIVVRQAPARVTVNLPVPTIRIEQDAPEIIVTMPDPTVSVGAAQPRVEVRQAEPRISVTQTPPVVDLELRRAAEGEEPQGVGVTDRTTGTSYAMGGQGEAVTTEDAEINMTSSEPKVTMVEPDEPANVEITRAEPNVTFEQSEPQVEYVTDGEPQIEFIQSGEPTVTFRQANAEGEVEGDTEASQLADTEATDEEMTDEAAEAEADVEQTAENAEAEVEETAENAEADVEENAEAIDAEAEETTAEMSEETDTTMADTDTADGDTVTTEAPVQMSGPMVEREGYEMVATGDIDYDTLEGMSVYGVNDEDVGEVGNLILGDDGQVSDVVIEVGGFLGLGEKHVLMPFDRLSFLRSADGDMRVYVDSSEEELEQLPEYDG